jgi:hypothetical protein
MPGRLIYEDRGARISIMARASAQGPDTLQQTVKDQLAQIHLQTRGGPYIRYRQRRICHPSRLAVAHLSLKLSRLS